MNAAAVPGIAGPTIVCTQVGNINTGAFDPVGEICSAVRPAGAWVHVDGAFGLCAAAVPGMRQLLASAGVPVIAFVGPTLAISRKYRM